MLSIEQEQTVLAMDSTGSGCCAARCEAWLSRCCEPHLRRPGERADGRAQRLASKTVALARSTAHIGYWRGTRQLLPAGCRPSLVTGHFGPGILVHWVIRSPGRRTGYGSPTLGAVTPVAGTCHMTRRTA